ncbi:CBASS cGAMP synthase [Stenotrophomonas rhizophila]|jgi:hypothetical protein|uniref:CBASS cGAMP synthase n=1 Tax=Stenotrophomonas TaxID=40323 RepID=UPI000C9B5C2C|nr:MULTISPECIES: hypothetical protein [Stenotrophomonas]MCW6027128.1 hypothetical protein [Stenotrophomonas sp. SRS1]MDY0956293.1 CBASS cGAMP synthase [Stenotrophomonas rhizophila]
MLDLSSLFHTTVDGNSCLREALDLTPAQRSVISDARVEVRNCLRAGIPRVLRERGYTKDVPEPRFFTQGSWAYKTINAPAQPPQQADLDDGCYLPLSFVSETKRPSIAARVFFNAAKEALAPLADRMGWELTEKPTCIRMVIAEHAHIDVPLYAIPDEEFTSLAKATMEHYALDSIAEAAIKAERDAWSALPKDKVLLAHGVDDWVASDPRPIKAWFLNEVEEKGEQFQRVVRYLKAFRDWHWPTKGPSSILLMAAAAPLFEKRERRDDLALLDVVSALPDRLRDGVSNPVESSESFTARLGKDGVEEAAKAFEALEVALRGSIDASNAAQACSWLRKEFGSRFPDEPDRVKVSSVKATILATAPSAGPSELVGRTKAG